MKIDDILSVSGLPGLFKMVANRHNGLVVESLETGDKRFCSVRKHQFTPLGSIALFTELDSIAIEDVFKKMWTGRINTEVPSPKGENDAIVSYMTGVVEDLDLDRVHINDMKKVLRWYHYLNQVNLLSELFEKDSNEEE